MPVFTDKEAPPPQEVQAEGDYKAKVIEFEAGISSGGKTAGCTQYKLKLEIEGRPCTVFEYLTDDSDRGKLSKCAWKIDTFVKCMGIKLAKGEGFEFTRELATAAGVKWVNPFGLRGWVKLLIETYTPEGGKTRKQNKIDVFYTDKEKLPPDAAMQAEAAAVSEPFS